MRRILKGCLSAAIFQAAVILNLSLPAFGINEYEKELSHCLIQGRIQYDNSNYEAALEWWNKALILDPRNAAALKYYTKVKEKLPALGAVSAPAPVQPKEKIPFIASRVKKKSSRYILQGKKYYCQHRYDWAISEWETALKLDPTNAEIADYIEKAKSRLKEKPSGRKPIEFDMFVKPPAPPAPEPAFERPANGQLGLEDAVVLGVKNHLPIQIAQEQVKLSKFREREVFRELFPEASIRWDESSGFVSSKDYTGRKYQLRLQHPLYHGGELRYTWEQAKVNLKIAQESCAKTIEDYTSELVKAYYDYIKAIRNFDTQGALLKELEQDLAMSKKE